MIRYVLRKCKNALIPSANGRWYAHAVVEETLSLEDLAEHMANHNCPYSRGVIIGILTDMVTCIKEQLLEGKNVRIDDLAIFSVGIVNKAGAEDPDDFTISANIEGVKLNSRATGTLSNKQLNLAATLKRASLDKLLTTSESDDEEEDVVTGNTNNSGSSSESSGSNKDEDLYEPGEDGMM
jgi:predicted histone-like DNA-binding protein